LNSELLTQFERYGISWSLMRGAAQFMRVAKHLFETKALFGGFYEEPTIVALVLL